MGRAVILVLCSLFLTGCMTLGRQSSASGGDSGTSERSSDLLKPSPVIVVGRIISIDTPSQSVIVETGPYAILPTDISQRLLIARDDAFQPTAQLQCSPYLRGGMMGTRLVAGTPRIGDEVVLYTPTRANEE